MSSIKSKIIEWGFKLTQKRALTSESKIKRRAAHLAYKPLKIFSKRANITETTVEGLPCLIVRPHGVINSKKIIYVHGGAFVLQISQFHYDFIIRLAIQSHTTVYVPIYPLSTETYSSCKDTFKMLLTLYQNLLKDTVNSNINLMGDSAGGNIVLSMAQQLKTLKLPKPANIIAISPPVDFSTNQEIGEQIAEMDPVLPWMLVKVASKWYVVNDDPRKSIYSPIYGDSKDIGMITIFIGDDEGFFAQVEQYHKHLDLQHIPHNFYVGKGMYHVYPIFKMPEGEEALAQIVKILSAS